MTGVQWLRYRHRVPSERDWQLEEAGRHDRLKRGSANDHRFYRLRYQPHGRGLAPATGRHWVGDLAVDCTADVESDTGALCFELRKGGRQFSCRIDVATGRAALSISGADMRPWRPTAATGVRGRGTHKILFSNCDDELRLWVDGQVVAFDASTAYADLQNHQPDPDDLVPVGIGSAGVRVRITHLRILRNIYYIADQVAVGTASANRGFARWSCLPTDEEQFFMLGDNSANSSDARLWGPDHYVSRDLLIGKAFFLYWPHSWNEIPTPWGDVPCPYFPNFRRMGFVR